MATKMKGKGKKKKGTGGLIDEGQYSLKCIGHKVQKINAGGKRVEFEFIGNDKGTGKRHFWWNNNYWHNDKKIAKQAREYYDDFVACCHGEDTEVSKAEEMHDCVVEAYIVQHIPDKKELKKYPKSKPRNVISYFIAAEGKKKKGKKKKGKSQPF